MRILQALGPLALSVDTCVFYASPGATVLEYYTPSIISYCGWVFYGRSRSRFKSWSYTSYSCAHFQQQPRGSIRCTISTGRISLPCIIPSITVQLGLVPLAPPHLRSPILIVAAARGEPTLGSLNALQPIITGIRQTSHELSLHIIWRTYTYV